MPTYLYVYLDPRKPGKYTYSNFISFLYEPFYIGKGQGNRAYSHLQEAYRTKIVGNRIKINKIKKIVATGQFPIISLLEHGTDLDMRTKEIYLINSIGIIVDGTGPLTNIKKDNSPPGRRPLLKRKYTPRGPTTTVYTENYAMRINNDLIHNFIANGFTVCPWQRPRKNNSMSRVGHKNPMAGRSAVKGRKWITTSSGKSLFLLPEEITALSEQFTYGRTVDKNKKLRIIIKGSTKSKYMTEEEVENLPAGTAYQIGLMWKDTRTTIIKGI